MRSSSNITIQNQSYFPSCHSKSDGIKLLINRFAAQNVNLNYSVTHYQDFYNIHRVRNCYLIFLLGDNNGSTCAYKTPRGVKKGCSQTGLDLASLVFGYHDFPEQTVCMAVYVFCTLIYVHELHTLTFKAPITTAADDKLCYILPSFLQK